MHTEVHNAVTAADQGTQYDESAKRLLGQKSILAQILVRTVDEFKGMNPRYVETLIEGEPYISRIPLEPGLTNPEAMRVYIPYADCHPDAAAGFTAQTQFHHLTMVCDAGLWARVPADQQAALQGVLENDPRPSYQHDPERVYGMEFGGLEVHFKVDGEVLTVTGIDRR